jgi:hypothetical protein
MGVRSMMFGAFDDGWAVDDGSALDDGWALDDGSALDGSAPKNAQPRSPEARLCVMTAHSG